MVPATLAKDDGMIMAAGDLWPRKDAPTQRAMFDQAQQEGFSNTRKGGWFLAITPEGYFELWRYHHLMLIGNVRARIVTAFYGAMLKTDVAGVNKFLEHFKIRDRFAMSPQGTQHLNPLVEEKR